MYTAARSTYGALATRRARRVVCTVHVAGRAPVRARYGSESDSNETTVTRITSILSDALCPSRSHGMVSDTNRSRAATPSRT